MTLAERGIRDSAGVDVPLQALPDPDRDWQPVRHEASGRGAV